MPALLHFIDIYCTQKKKGYYNGYCLYCRGINLSSSTPSIIPQFAK